MNKVGWSGPFSSGVASGSSGSATANTDTDAIINGAIAAVYVRYNDSPPGTTDVTIATAGNNTPSYDILTLTDANTDGTFYPREKADDNTGSAISGDVYTAPLVDDNINVKIEGADSGDSVDVWFYVVA